MKKRSKRFLYDDAIDTGRISREFPRDGTMMYLLNKEELQNSNVFKLSGYAKIPGIIDFLTKIIKQTKDKFIVFAYHQRVLNSIEEFICSLLGKGAYVRVDGNDNSDMKYKKIKSF